LKAVVGVEALSVEEKRYLKFEEDFERTFLRQDAYDNRDIFNSLNKAWDLLEQFPREDLKQISTDILDMFYTRDARDKYEMNRKKGIFLEDELAKKKKEAEAKKKAEQKEEKSNSK
jgi:vacuolar-type H+-ATPase catalytic subunit A/Vma1